MKAYGIRYYSDNRDTSQQQQDLGFYTSRELAQAEMSRFVSMRAAGLCYVAGSDAARVCEPQRWVKKEDDTYERENGWLEMIELITIEINDDWRITSECYGTGVDADLIDE